MMNIIIDIQKDVNNMIRHKAIENIYTTGYIIYEPKYTPFKHAKDMYIKLINVFNDKDFNILYYDNEGIHCLTNKDRDWTDFDTAWTKIGENIPIQIYKPWTFQVQFTQKEHLILAKMLLNIV